MESLSDRIHTIEAWPTELLLRRGLVALAALSFGATTTELVLLQHWGSPMELIPWFALGLLAVAITLVARPSRRNIRTARVVGGVVLGIAAIGVAIHVWTNYEAGPLDAEYMFVWDSLAEPIRWLLAATATVGPSPALAPLALAFSSLCLLLSTVRDPLLVRTSLAPTVGLQPVAEVVGSVPAVAESVSPSGQVGA